MNKYPEHEKIKALGNQNQIIGSFLEWLQHGGFSICKYIEEPRRREGYEPSRNNIQEWLAEYFDIDLKALEKEKQKMLDEMRKS